MHFHATTPRSHPKALPTVLRSASLSIMCDIYIVYYHRAGPKHRCATLNARNVFGVMGDLIALNILNHNPSLTNI